MSRVDVKLCGWDTMMGMRLREARMWRRVRMMVEHRRYCVGRQRHLRYAAGRNVLYAAGRQLHAAGRE